MWYALDHEQFLSSSILPIIMVQVMFVPSVNRIFFPLFIIFYHIQHTQIHSFFQIYCSVAHQARFNACCFSSTQNLVSQISTLFTLVTALLPEQAKTSYNWPELIRPGGVHQLKEARSQGGGCVHSS